MNKSETNMKDVSLERSMPAFPIAMIGIGGTLGTGLFLSSGYTISNAGPGGTLLSYALGGLIMYLMMLCLGELIVAIPDAGGIQAFANRFLNHSVGFTVGWIRWLSLVITVPTQLVASSIIMKNIFPTVPSIIWIGIFTVLLFFLNFKSAISFGKFNNLFNSIKLIFIAIFIIIGIGMIFGIGQSDPVGFSNFTEHGGLFPNGGSAVIQTMMVSAFAFGGADQIATAASESRNPSVDMPRAIKIVMLGLLITYFTSFILILAILPWNQANLAGSPFAYVFREAGFSSAELLVNVVVLTSALSSANSFVYSSIRSLWALGKEKQAPKWVTRTNDKGLPKNSLLIVFTFSIIAVISAFVSPDVVYLFLQSIIGISNMVIYILYAICLIRFRKSLEEKNISANHLEYKVKRYPLVPLSLLILCSLVFIGMIFDPTQTRALGFGIPTYLVIYLFGKIYYRNKLIGGT